MALDLTGIENVEFYSGHYLDAVLEGDLRQVFDTWRKAERDSGTTPPYKRLDRLVNRFFTALATARDERDEAARFEAARAFHAELVTALGYDYHPDVEPLDQGEVLPVVASYQRDGRRFLWIVDALTDRRRLALRYSDPSVWPEARRCYATPWTRFNGMTSYTCAWARLQEQLVREETNGGTR